MSTSQDRLNELLVRREELQEQGQDPSAEELCADCPELLEELEQAIQDVERVKRIEEEVEPTPTNQASGERVPLSPPNKVPCPVCGSFIPICEAWQTSPTNHACSLGKFRLLWPVGQGSFGTVWRAWDTGLKREVAVKRPHGGQFAGRPEEEERFRREAEAVAQLDHPGIVQVYDVVRDHGTVYLVTKLVRGVSLAQWLKNRQPDFRQAAEWAAQVASALDFAHRKGVVHRDVKPSNIMLQPDESLPGPGISGTARSAEAPRELPTTPGRPLALRVFVTDFGMAKRDAGEPTITLDGQWLGTPAYMSPEQIRNSHTVDRRSDIYSAGVVLYQLLTEQLPFTGETTEEVLRRVRDEDPPPPRNLNREIPKDLETICLKAMAKEPAQRYGSAQDLADDLERFLKDEPIHARPERLARRLWRRIRRHPQKAVVVGLVAVAALFMIYVPFHVRRAGQIRALTAAFDAKLDEQKWTSAHVEEMEAHVEEMEAILAKLDRLDPEQATAAQRQLVQGLAKFISSHVHGIPPLQPEDVTRIRAALDLLATRAPKLEGPLRQAFEERLGILQRVLDWPNRADVEAPGRLRRPTDDSPLLLTKVSCQGNVQFEAVFHHPSWQQATQVGLVLNASPDGKSGYYAFLLSVPLSPPTAEDLPKAELPPSLGVARKVAGGSLRLQIMRGGVRLREQYVQVADEPLRLWAARRGDRLTFQVNSQPSVDFEDVFPPSGPAVFGLHCPAGVCINSLQAWRSVLSAKPSLLERGDDSYARGEWAEALSHYRAQLSTTQDPQVRQELRCKEALCLAALGHYDEAAPLLEKTIEEKEGRWRPAAACQLLLIRLRQIQREKDPPAKARAFDKAEALFHRIAEFEPQLANLVPDAEREKIIREYHEQARLQLRVDERQIHYLKRAAAIGELFQVPAETSFWTQWLLLQAHEAAGQRPLAVPIAQKLLEQSLPPRCHINVRTFLAELPLASDEPRDADLQRALEVLDRQLFTQPGVYAPDFLPLLLTRGRVHAALQQWLEAEKDLDDFFREMPEERKASYPAAYVLQGFLRERRGDAAGALKTWCQGWSLVRGTSAMNTTSGFILGSLANELSEAEAKQMLEDWNKTYGKGFPISTNLMYGLMPLPEVTITLRNTWRSPRGREFARRFAFKRVSRSEHQRDVLCLTVAEAMRQGAVVGEFRREQDDLIWELVRHLYDCYMSNPKARSLLPLHVALAWRGLRSWESAAHGLDQPACRLLAYVLGCRYVHLEKLDEARSLFHTALRDAPADSALWRLTKEELGRLEDR